MTSTVLDGLYYMTLEAKVKVNSKILDLHFMACNETFESKVKGQI